MVFGLILAGGIGSRMGSTDKPKQFLEIGGKPVILHTLERFMESNDIDGIYILCPDAWVDYTVSLINKHMSENKEVFSRWRMPDVSGREASECLSSDDINDKYGFIKVISGGESRNETIMRGIDAIENEYGVDGETLIITHDAARPFIDIRIIKENIEAAKKDGAATTAVPATDTILECHDGKVSEIPDRAFLYQCQTPQTFHARQLREAYNALSDEEKEILTDASKIMLLKGCNVSLVMGDIRNIKVTYPSDMEVAESFLNGTMFTK